MWRTKPARGSARLLYVLYISLRCSWRGLASSFWGRVSNLKGLKRFPRRVARRIVGPRTPIDDSFVLSCPLAYSSSRLIPFRLFSLLSPVPVVTYCELLRELCRTALKKAVSFGAQNFGQHEKWCGQPARLQYVSSRFVVTRAAGIASFVVCDNNFYDAHWLSGDRWRYCGPRRGETPPRRARIREDLS